MDDALRGGGAFRGNIEADFGTVPVLLLPASCIGGPPDTLFAFGCLRSRAQSAVKPAASVCHRWALARAAAAGPRSAPDR